MYATKRDFELARKALLQMEEVESALVNAWAEAFYRGSVGYFTKADAKTKAAEKFKRELQTFDYSEMQDYKILIEEGLAALEETKGQTK